MGSTEKKKEEEPEWLFLQSSLLREVPSTLFHFAGPAAGRIKGWILREIQSALKELWQSM